MLLLTLVLPSSPAPRAARLRPPLPSAAVASARPLLIQQWLRLPGEARPRARWLTLR